MAENNPPPIIDLTGGSPDIIPEWPIWMMKALEKANLSDRTYLWSDDNLSTEYIFDKLTSSQLDILQSYKNYGRVCCFKGYDSTSFSFNTNAHSEDFERQFLIMSRLLTLDIDIYGYVTLTAQDDYNLRPRMTEFVDRLQNLSENLPLRIIPLKIDMFSPVRPRMNEIREVSLKVQEAAIKCWNEEIHSRFDAVLLNSDICDVPINRTSWNT